MRPLPERLRDFRTKYAKQRSKGEMIDTSPNLQRPSTPPDVASGRAKSQRHGKVTADHWNQ
jgi:hypothetical protein